MVCTLFRMNCLSLFRETSFKKLQCIQKDEVMIHATTYMKLGNIMLSEKCQTEKTMYCMILFRWSVQTESRLVVTRGWDEWGHGTQLFNGSRIFFWVFGYFRWQGKSNSCQLHLDWKICRAIKNVHGQILDLGFWFTSRSEVGIECLSFWIEETKIITAASN